MAKYYLSVLYKDKRGDITEEHNNLTKESSNFLCEKESNRIYYDIPLESILKDKANDLKYIAYFTMEFNNTDHLKDYLIKNNLMPEYLKNKRMNIYTTYKNVRYGLETGIPNAKTKHYLNPQTIRKYYLNKFDDNKNAYFQDSYSKNTNPLPVDFKFYSRFYRILEDRYKRPNYRGSIKALENVYHLNDNMQNKKGRIGYKVKDVRNDLKSILDRELYIKSDSNQGINYHGLFVLANLIAIHNKWLANESVKAQLEMIDEATQHFFENYSLVEEKPLVKQLKPYEQLNFFDKL